MAIQETSISFPVTRGSGPRNASSTLVFPREVTKAVAAVRGYQIGFVGDDHHVGILQVELDTSINNNVVIVNGKLGCRDWSGSWDDEYNGAIQVTVIAELASVTAPEPRGDLQILDVEVNQATQFFRAAEHLDAANVMPDNSMPLIGGKMTGLRFYTDYDATAGLPAISNLSGTLTVRQGGAIANFSPLATITPIRTTEIDRAQVDHTLNFAIPAAWCRGRLDISCRIFDAANPAQTSASFQKTLQFVDVNPLRVYGVGINYTGMGLNLPAPTIGNLNNTFNFTRRVWPTGDVLTSGFTTIMFSDNMAGVAADGCGSGFNNLLSQLRDIKGDTDDLVYGLLPTGTPLTGVAGCGGGGAGSGVNGDQVTAAHEAGHAVGRKHAPCDDSSRCDTPQNTDDNFPLYGNYVSDSIGEFGFDPSVNRVHDPSTRRDFMGYSGNDWISPYTYRALLTKGDPISFTPSARRNMFIFAANAIAAPDGNSVNSQERAEWIKQRIPLLFLRLWVDRKKVTLTPSFTYPAYIRRPGNNSEYEVHLEDAKGAVLACVRLQMACGTCDHDCGPLELLGEVPWADSAKQLVLRKDGTDIERFDIEEPPKLKVKTTKNKSGEYKVSWEAIGDSDDLNYLLQWQDYDGTWRGISPRTKEHSILIPKRYQFADRKVLKLRLLAVHLLHTALEEFEIKTSNAEPPIVVDVNYQPENKTYYAFASDAVGRMIPSDNLVWYDDNGGELAKGNALSIKSLSNQEGVATVKLIDANITATEGYALLNPRKKNPKEICGYRPNSSASIELLKQAGILDNDKK
ncbi:hypothetical protein ACJD0Z_09345 [Flavobacteriaceae bacterium M23B6Z8]